MEFKFSVNEVFRQPVVKIGSNLLPPGFTGDRRAFWDVVAKVSEVVNAMGESSAAAQGLTKPITSAERLRNSEQAIYLLIDQNAANGRGAVTGMLKTGKKGLYVFDRNGQHYQVSPPCVLDFYIHESRQRTGLGKRLFEHMLQVENVEPVKMAIDRPSEKFLGFLNKHYSLNTPVKQMNNYVVFDGFFPSTPEKNGAVEVDNSVITPGKKQSANGLQTSTYASPLGRYGAPRPPCSMGQIIHNQTSTIPQNTEPTGVEGVRSAPETNQQNTPINYSPGNPNIIQSTPNVYYRSHESQVKLDGMAPNPVYPADQQLAVPVEYYPQPTSNTWQNVGKPANVRPTFTDVENYYPQQNPLPQVTNQQAQNVRTNQLQEVVQGQAIPVQHPQGPNQNAVQNPAANIPQNQGMTQNPNVTQNTDMMYNAGQTQNYMPQYTQSVPQQNMQQYATQGVQNNQQLSTSYSTQGMQPTTQQQMPAVNAQSMVPQTQEFQNTGQVFLQQNAAANTQYVPEVQSNAYIPQLQQFNAQYQQPNLQNNAQYAYGPAPPNQQIFEPNQPVSGYANMSVPNQMQPNAVGYMPQPPQYTTNSTLQYPVQSMTNTNVAPQMVQNQMTNQVLQPSVMTNQVSQPHVAMTNQVSQPVVAMSNQASQPVVAMSNQASQPVVAMSNQASQPVVAMSNQASQPVVAMANQMSQENVAMANQMSQQNVAMPNQVSQQNVAMPSQVPQQNVAVTNQVSQPNVGMPNQMAFQPTVPMINENVAVPQYQYQLVAPYATEAMARQPSMMAGTNVNQNVATHIARQSVSQADAAMANNNQYNGMSPHNPQNVAPAALPKSRVQSARIRPASSRSQQQNRNPQIADHVEGNHISTNVMNEQPPVKAQGDAGDSEEVSFKYGYPPQVPNHETQVMEEKVSSSPKLERPRSLSIQLSEEQTEDKKNDVESEVPPKETEIEEELIEKLAITENSADDKITTPENKTPGKKTPSHLTEQGFFDLKFYHNKLW